MKKTDNKMSTEDKRENIAAVMVFIGIVLMFITVGCTDTSGVNDPRVLLFALGGAFLIFAAIPVSGDLD